MQLLQNTLTEILLQLKDVVTQLGPINYCKQSAVVAGKTPGMHVRHVVEFIQCLHKGYETGVVDYDSRERNLQIEEDAQFSTSCIDKLLKGLERAEDKKILLTATYPGLRVNEVRTVETSYLREIIYNIEHVIHHLAILRIIIECDFAHIKLSDDFGYAHSTVAFLNEAACAQ